MAAEELTQDLSVPLGEVPVGEVRIGEVRIGEVPVAECGWRQVLPGLPDDVIALLATPVEVTAEALTRAARSASPPAGIDECTPRFLAPTPPRRIRHRHRFA